MNKFFICLLFVGFLLPITGEAASSRPSCVLSVSSGHGEFTTSKSKALMREVGLPIDLEWTGNNATSATFNGSPIAISGETTITPSVVGTRTYAYTFKNGSKKATCSVTVHAYDAAIDHASLTSLDAKPIITGTAQGLKKVQLTVKEDVFSERPIYSKTISVNKGKWQAKLPKALADGTYHVDLRGPSDLEFNYIISGTLTVSANDAPELHIDLSKPDDGTVHSGVGVQFATATITNTSGGTATIDGVWVTRSGTAPELAVYGLGMEADNGEGNGVTGMIEGYTPFKNGYAHIPGMLTLSPGETRELTMEVFLSKNEAYMGESVRINVHSFTTYSEINGESYLNGPLFTIGSIGPTPPDDGKA